MTSSTERIFENFKFIKHKNEFYEIFIFPEVEFEIKDLNELVNAQKEMGGDVLPVLVDCGDNASTNIELMKHLSIKENDPYSKVDAFVIKSAAQRILGNFYLKMIKPERPTRLFNNKDEAYKWIKQYM